MSCCKDEIYDPFVNCESGSDTELIDSAPVSPSFGDQDLEESVLNDTRTGRSGGPQADNDGKGSPATALKGQKIGECISCLTKNVPLWKGNRYRCHETPAKRQQRAHNSFCKVCAYGLKDDGDALSCPKHCQMPWPASEVIPLEPVYNTD